VGEGILPSSAPECLPRDHGAPKAGCTLLSE
jgi:hypothetical protein